MKRKQADVESALLKVFTLLLVFISVFIIASRVTMSQYNYDHVNVTVQVNITNAAPEILSVEPMANITLNAGTTKTVYCNSTIRDWNLFSDIDVVTATFYHFYNTSTQSDDTNEHYTNASCAEVANDGLYIANYSCSFTVQYYAYNGSWSCNLTVNDTSNFLDSANNTTSINPLYALNVTSLIDYGNLSVDEYSSNVSANVTNFGNMIINVSVLGYGRTQGDGWGLVCATGDNITVANQRFYHSPADWANKIPLAATNQDMNFTLSRQTEDATVIRNETWWQLYVPPNPFGVCNGTVRFTATAS